MVDGSFFVGANNWVFVQEFVNGLISMFTVGPGATDTRIAFIVYETDAYVIFDFQEYTDKEAMQRAVYATS